jgi:light-regulated signal transduction histidine kinase (bacteriophytochrome)
MGELIDGLLTLSRVERAGLSRSRVSVSEIARTIADELGQNHPERPVAFAIAPGLTVEADRRLVRALLDNLMGNAWKFTGKSPSPRIELGATEHSDGTVYFVRDNGAGFDMAYADKLFRPFQRLHSDGDFPGTGIGLATVQRIVERHGGRVWAEGAVGRGATVFFTLPPNRSNGGHS